MLNLEVDLDPSTNKVVLIGILIFLETLIGSLITLLQSTQEPTMNQVVLIVLIAALQLVTFFSTFIRTGEIPEETTEES